MTAAEAAEEWQYIYAERLGMLCEDRQPTETEIATARAAADEWIELQNDNAN